MTMPNKLFFIGWDYAAPVSAPVSVVLKHALMDPDFPWQPVAIVHDVLLTDSVDNIPLMHTREFLARPDLAEISVLLLVKDDVQKTLWLRRARELGLRMVDQGELLRGYSAHLATLGHSRTLGPVVVPQAFDDQACSALLAYSESWIDTLSQRTFKAYLAFLQTGLISAFSTVTSAEPSEHPFFQSEDGYFEDFKKTASGGLVWEIAERRSAFLEQTLVRNNIGAWQYAFSALDLHQAKAEGTRLALLLESLGIVPALSILKVTDDEVIQRPVGAAPLPILGTSTKWVRVDVDQPVRLLQWLITSSQNLHVKMRIRRPMDLLQCLQLFPSAQLTLRCDRPGPSGLELIFRLNNAASAGAM